LVGVCDHNVVDDVSGVPGRKRELLDVVPDEFLGPEKHRDEGVPSLVVERRDVRPVYLVVERRVSVRRRSRVVVADGDMGDAPVGRLVGIPEVSVAFVGVVDDDVRRPESVDNLSSFGIPTRDDRGPPVR
jgi:hypothetical protein